MEGNRDLGRWGTGINKETFQHLKVFSFWNVMIIPMHKETQKEIQLTFFQIGKTKEVSD